VAMASEAAVCPACRSACCRVNSICLSARHNDCLWRIDSFIGPRWSTGPVLFGAPARASRRERFGSPSQQGGPLAGRFVAQWIAVDEPFIAPLRHFTLGQVDQVRSRSINYWWLRCASC
jgi:hypothetical protein